MEKELKFYPIIRTKLKTNYHIYNFERQIDLNLLIMRIHKQIGFNSFYSSVFYMSSLFYLFVLRYIYLAETPDTPNPAAATTASREQK